MSEEIQPTKKTDLKASPPAQMIKGSQSGNKTAENAKKAQEVVNRLSQKKER